MLQLSAGLEVTRKEKDCGHVDDIYFRNVEVNKI